MRFIKFVFIPFSFLAVLVLFIPNIIAKYPVALLSPINIFLGNNGSLSAESVSGLSWYSAHFKNIQFKNNVIVIKADELDLTFSPLTLLKLKLHDAKSKNVSVSFKPSAAANRISTPEASRSPALNIPSIPALDIALLTVEINSDNKTTIKNLSIHPLNDGAGSIQASRIHYNKWQADAILGMYNFTKPAKLDIHLTSFLLMQSPASAEFSATLEEPRQLKLTVNTRPLPLQQIFSVMEWDKKVSVSGSLSGAITLQADAKGLSQVIGQWDSSAEGDMIITDQALFEKIASSSKQPVEIIKASFEKYHYNKGSISVKLDQKTIRAFIHLEGEAGKRDLEVNLYDLF